ncbi:MAG TPA: SRPBCC domain-containing protein [Metabacillus sp.]|nr:SRPBCC domain-containing protein [Metabacillus sp.]
MTKQLIVKDEVLIEATPSRVWEILTKPKFVAQWDELPEDYPSEDMTKGSQVIWELPNGGKSITTIIKAEEMKELIISLFVSKWEIQLNEGDVAYRYQLEKRGNQTLLKIEIGDFSLISNGQMYYDASVEFAANSKKVIKQLAEEYRT